MSQQTKKEFLEAAAKAKQASNSALPDLASASSAFESAKSARAILQQNLQNTTDFQTKQELTRALKQFDNTVYNPAKVALDTANKRVYEPLEKEQSLIQQANTAAQSPDNSNNIPNPANNNPGDATQYTNISQYEPGSGALGPVDIVQQTTTQQATVVTNATATTVSTPDTQTQLASIITKIIEDVPQTGVAVETTNEVVTYAVAPQTTLTVTDVPDESRIIRINNPTAEQTAFFEANDVKILPQVVAEPYSNPSTEDLRINTASEPVINELGETVTGVRRNLETGELYTVPVTIDSEPILNELGETAQGIRRNLETGETYYTSNTATSNTATSTPRARTQDLRVRISLAPNANYMYNIAESGDILYPLKETNGVIFPYTPTISLGYNANYESTDVVHSNYKLYNYRNSSVDNISIMADFTAQDTNEANYLLAVIHFFRTVTKMFYGQDSNPTRGAPPPLVYLNGYGKYAFNMHPMAITGFTLNYPNDVDYINAGARPINVQQQLTKYNPPTQFVSRNRRIVALQRSGLNPGGTTSNVQNPSVEAFNEITRVPTKINLTITAIPIIPRKKVSNEFSLKNYATGALLQNKNQTGGFW